MLSGVNINMKVICPYCNKKAAFVTGEVVYPHRNDLHEKWFYLCRVCDAYVGCHVGSGIPLGRLANSELRKAKQAAHEAFDILWKETPIMSRKAAYVWLSAELSLSLDKTHIGMFDVNQCNKVVELSNAKYDEWLFDRV